MDILSYAIASKQSRRIKRFIADPDSNSGIITTPSKIAAGEVITIPVGRTAILPDMVIEGELIIEGDAFIPSGGSYNQVDMICDNIKSRDKTVTIETKQLVDTVREQDISGKKNFLNGLTTQGENITPYTGFKNLLVNGNFDFWTMGDNQDNLTSNYGSDDRWDNAVSLTGARTHSKVLVSHVERELFNATYFSRTSTTGLTNNRTFKAQRIKNLYRTSGKKLTLSFWAKADGDKSINVLLYHNYGVDGSPNEEITTKIDLTSSWVKYIFTVTMPKTNGKTIGTNNFLGCLFDIDRDNYPYLTNRPIVFDLAQVQLEIGDKATPFEFRPYDLEQILCGSSIQTTSFFGYDPFYKAMEKGNKNLFINGCLRIWDKGTTVATTALNTIVYGPNRWYMWATGANYSMVKDTLTTTGVSAVKLVGAASNTTALIGQRIEGINALGLIKNNSVISFRASSSENLVITYVVGVATVQNGLNVVNTVKYGSFTITTTEDVYEIKIPPIPEAYKGVRLELVVVGGLLAGKTITYGELQWEVGSVATAFEKRQIGMEGILCRRYYEIYTGVPALRMANYTTGAMNFNTIQFKNPKRTTPTMYVTNANVFTVASASVTGFTFGAQASINDFFVIATKAAHGLTDAVLATGITWVADAEIY